MRRVLCMFILSNIIFMSCGPNEQEKAAQQKMHDDSLASAVTNKIEAKKKIENEIVSAKSTIEKLKDDLSIAKGEAAAAQDKMTSIKEWELGRTTSEREEQVKNQTVIIEEANRKVSDIENAIKDAEAAKEQLQIALKEF